MASEKILGIREKELIEFVRNAIKNFTQGERLVCIAITLALVKGNISSGLS